MISRWCLLAATAPLLSGCHSLPEKNGDGWISLFNGKDLTGWEVHKKEADRGQQFWSVEDGTILCDSMGRGQHDYVWLGTVEEYGDFELELEVQTFSDSPGNSGVQVRSRYDAVAGWLDGPQIDVHPPAAWRTGFIYDETRTTKRWICPSLPDWRIEVSHAREGWNWQHAGDEDAWNRIRIIADGDHIKTFVNSVAIADFDGKEILDDEGHRRHRVGKSGYIYLQLHSNDELRIKFRNIRLREIGEPPAQPR